MNRYSAIPLLLFSIACHGGGAEQQGVPNVTVETATVVADSITDQVELIGRLTTPPGGSALLSAPAAGVVGPVSATVGSRVSRGATIVTLDVPELEANARQLAAAADLAEREAARQQKLLADGIAARKQVDQATSDAVSARAAAGAAEALLARTRIASPIDGVVQRVMVQSGVRVESGAPVAEVVAPGTLEFDAAVSAAVLGRLRAGLSATILIDGDTAAIEGKVRAVAPAVDSLTNTGLVIVRVGRSGTARPGAPARARVALGGRRSALLVPDAAITRVGDSLAIYLVGPDSLAHQRIVRLGARSAGRTEIHGDVRPGDRIVTAGSAGLTDGVRLTIAPATP